MTMQISLKKIGVVSLALAIAGQAFSAQDKVPASSKTQMSQIEQKNVLGGMGGKNPSIRETTTKDGFFIYADFLYWYSTEGALEYAIKTTTPAPFLVTPQLGDLKSLDFEFDPGVRVGIGYNVPYDGWDICAIWTYYQNKSSDSTAPPAGGGLFPLWEFNNATGEVDSAKATWKFTLNTLDVELGRFYFVSYALALRPFVSARGAWLDQNFNTTYVRSLDNFQTNNKNDYHAGGPRTGLDMRWFFVRNFGFYAKASVSILLGNFNVKQKEETTTSNPVIVDATRKFPRVRTNLEILLGFMGDAYFDRNRRHFGIFAGWEFHKWFAQNELTRFSQSGAFLTDKETTNNLGISGFTLRARFDF